MLIVWFAKINMYLMTYVCMSDRLYVLQVSWFSWVPKLKTDSDLSTKRTVKDGNKDD
jgi:hypothetical protein